MKDLADRIQSIGYRHEMKAEKTAWRMASIKACGKDELSLRHRNSAIKPRGKDELSLRPEIRLRN
jgi:hypothetical protein